MVHDTTGLEEQPIFEGAIGTPEWSILAGWEVGGLRIE
jgi:hypothetical protein